MLLCRRRRDDRNASQHYGKSVSRSQQHKPPLRQWARSASNQLPLEAKPGSRSVVHRTLLVYWMKITSKTDASPRVSEANILVLNGFRPERSSIQMGSMLSANRRFEWLHKTCSLELASDSVWRARSHLVAHRPPDRLTSDQALKAPTHESAPRSIPNKGPMKFTEMGDNLGDGWREDSVIRFVIHKDYFDSIAGDPILSSTLKNGGGPANPRGLESGTSSRSICKPRGRIIPAARSRTP